MSEEGNKIGGDLVGFLQAKILGWWMGMQRQMGVPCGSMSHVVLLRSWVGDHDGSAKKNGQQEYSGQHRYFGQQRCFWDSKNIFGQQALNKLGQQVLNKFLGQQSDKQVLCDGRTNQLKYNTTKQKK